MDEPSCQMHGDAALFPIGSTKKHRAIPVKRSLIVPRISKPTGGTTLIGVVLRDCVVIAAESRLARPKIEEENTPTTEPGAKEAIEVVYLKDRPGVKRYALEDYKKVVSLAGHLVFGAAGTRFDGNQLRVQLSGKLSRMAKQGKKRPPVRRLAYFLGDYARQVGKDLRVKQDFSALLAGFDDKVLQVYSVVGSSGLAKKTKLPHNDVKVKDCTKETIIYEGTGARHARKYIQERKWYDKDLPPIYVADQLFEAIEYASTKDPNSNGVIRAYILTEKNIVIRKYSRDGKLGEVVVEETDDPGTDLEDEGYLSADSWKTDDD